MVFKRLKGNAGVRSLRQAGVGSWVDPQARPKTGNDPDCSTESRLAGLGRDGFHCSDAPQSFIQTG
jgi:hypothetical protein